MTRAPSIAHVLFATTFVALGIIGLIGGKFAPVWQPVPKAVPAREALAYLSAIVSVATGMGLLWRRAAAPAARVLLASLLIWFVLFRIPVALRAPSVEVSWEGCGETAVILAGAWVLYAWLASDWDRQRLGFAVGESGVRLARVIYGLALIPLGLAHIVYLKQTAALVPAWLPSHEAWAYFTGCAYIAAGVAVLLRVLAKPAAVLSALQIGLFTLLVWVPILATGPRGASDWSESLISWALTAAALVVADSYRLCSAAPSGQRPRRAGQEVVSHSGYDSADRR
jgi:uncharacterized membrane protein